MTARYPAIVLTLAAAACGTAASPAGGGADTPDGADSQPSASTAVIMRLRTLPADTAAPSRNAGTIRVQVGDWAANQAYLMNDASSPSFTPLPGTGSSVAVDANACTQDAQAATVSCTVAFPADLGAQASSGLAVGVSDSTASGGQDDASAQRWFSTFSFVSAAQLQAARAGDGHVEGDLVVVTDNFYDELTVLAGASNRLALLARGAMVGVLEDGQQAPHGVSGVSVALAAAATGTLVLPTADLSAARASATTDTGGIFLVFPEQGKAVSTSSLTLDGSAAAGTPSYRLPNVFAAGNLILTLRLSPAT